MACDVGMDVCVHSCNYVKCGCDIIMAYVAIIKSNYCN